MKKSLIIIGVAAMILGIFANIYFFVNLYLHAVTQSTESNLWGLFITSSTSIPYSVYSISLLVGGVVLIIVGAVIKENKK